MEFIFLQAAKYMRKVYEPISRPLTARVIINRKRLLASNKNNINSKSTEKDIINKVKNKLRFYIREVPNQRKEIRQYKYAVYDPGPSSLPHPLEYVNYFLKQFNFPYKAKKKGSKIYLVFIREIKSNLIPPWIYNLGSFLDSNTVLY